jgi:hypothetical protein
MCKHYRVRLRRRRAKTLPLRIRTCETSNSAVYIPKHTCSRVVIAAGILLSTVFVDLIRTLLQSARHQTPV